MPRRVQDIVPGDRRGIRETPAESDKKSRKTPDKEPEVSIPIHKKEPISAPSGMRRMPVTPPAPPNRPKRQPNRIKWLFVALGIIVIVGVIGFIASSFYSRASFTIVPKVVPLTINGTYVAQATPATGVLSYEVVTVKGAASSTVPATDGPQTSTKATGKILLTNSYSSQSVRLIAGTRLSNESGLIYRLSSSVIIPGSSTTSGSVTAGKIAATVVADQAGQEYNLAKSEASPLKIVAYKNSAKYDTIVGSLTSDISGGYVGVKKTVNPTTVASTSARLKSALTVQLLQQVKGAIPDGYIMYDGNYATAFGQPIVGGTDKNMATVSVEGSVYGILFKKSDLIAKLSSNQSATAFGDFGFTSPGLETIQVQITNLKDFAPDKKTALVLHAKGDMKLVGTVPVDDIKKKLAGSSLASTQDIFKSYSPVIVSGSGELVPPWAKIPSDPERITVTVDTK